MEYPRLEMGLEVSIKFRFNQNHSANPMLTRGVPHYSTGRTKEYMERKNTWEYMGIHENTGNTKNTKNTLRIQKNTLRIQKNT